MALSEAGARRAGELHATWQAVAVSGILVDPDIVKRHHEDIAKVGAVLAKAEKGEADGTDILDAEKSARAVMATAYEKTGDPRFGPDKRPRGGDVPDPSFWLDPVAAAQKTADAAIKDGPGAVIPTEYKIAGGVALVLLLVIALKW